LSSKSERFPKKKEHLPGPGAYNVDHDKENSKSNGFQIKVM